VISIIFDVGEGVPGLHPHANFTVAALKMWAYSPQNRQFLV